MFVNIIGDDFELGIFTKQSSNNEDAFFVILEISSEDCSLNSD
jgi:hypothetical protein